MSLLSSIRLADKWEEPGRPKQVDQRFPKCAQPGECGLAARERAEVLKDIAVRWGAVYLTRADNCQAKAGNINSAR